MGEVFDAIIIGAGPAGNEVALDLAHKNWRIAIIEEDGFGGTCPLRGCIPKKVLATVTEMTAKTKRYQPAGLIAETRIDWGQLQQFRKSFVDVVPEQKEKQLIEAGVTTIHGHASFVGEKQVRANGRILQSDKILIATGARPMELPIKGKEHLIYSDDFLELEQLPERIVFIGGGYISFEFAHIAANSGSEVHILQRGECVLEGFDPDLVETLVEESENLGVHVHVNRSAEKVEKTDSGYMVTTEGPDGKETWSADLVVAAAGRAPNLDRMDLDEANIKFDKSGVLVNPFMQSVTNPYVYAAGDVTSTDAPQLTPVAHLEGRAVVHNWTHGNEQKPVYELVPSAVFTIPRLAAVGMSVEKAKEKELETNILDIDLGSWFTYKVQNNRNARAKIITDAKNGHVLGAHIVGDEADEMINLFAIACQLKLRIEDLKQLVLAFPTASSDFPSYFK